MVVQEGLGELAATVSAEVEPENDVAVVDALGVRVAEHHRQEELVGFLVGVFGGDGLGGEDVHLLADAVNDRIPGELVAVPAFVAIHRVVAPDHGDDLCVEGGELILAIGEILLAPGRRSVAAVGDGVHGDVLDPGFAGGLGERDQVLLVRVDAAVRDEAEQVQALAFGFLECLGEIRHVGEFVVRDAQVDASEVLVDDAPGAEVEVADF